MGLRIFNVFFQWAAPQFSNEASSSVTHADFTLAIAIRTTLSWSAVCHTGATPNPYLQSSGSGKFGIYCHTTSQANMKTVYVICLAVL